MQVRVGIETGEVLAGPSRDAQAHYAVSGGCVTVALGFAQDGSSELLVGEQTYRSTYQHVQYRTLPAVQPRGFDTPLMAWEPVEVSHGPRLRTRANAPFVGRQDELDVLLGTLTRVLREQRPHLVSLLGEPGIGKTRLVAEFERRILALTSIKVLRGRCCTPPTSSR